MIGTVLSSASGGLPVPQDIAPTPSAASVNAFEDAMARQSVAQAGEPVAASEGVKPAGGAAQADLDAQARARQGLDLQGAQPPQAEGGDMILQGVERLRGVFDVREAHITDLMKGQVSDANKLMAIQLEVTNFTLLVDMSSKLTGKATQSFDTLMKGQ